MRFGARTIRRDLLLVLGLVSVLTLGSTFFGLFLIQRNTRLVDEVFADYLALSQCCEQVLMGQSETTGCMSRALSLQGPDAEAELEALRRAFLSTTQRSAVFINAMIWGSESEAFARAAGGSLATAWQAQGAREVPVVRPAPADLRQRAGLADIYFAAFARRVLRVLDTCENRLRIPQTAPEQAAAHAGLEAVIREAYEYRQLSTTMLQQVVQQVHADLKKAAANVQHAQDLAAAMLLTVALLAGAVSLGFGWVFATFSIVRPLERLRAGTAVIGAGNLDHHVGTAAPDEIGQLSRAFDGMVESLRSVMARRDELDREVAQRKRAEADLVRVLDELKRSNAELEQFAYVASHDLQEPLRKISAFGDLLAEECRGALRGEAGDYLARMINAAKRMQTLINDLLALSRVSTRGQPFAPVDLNQTLAEVVSDLDSRVVAAGAHIEVGPLPTVEADPIQMHQLFQNLVGNAIKFRREGVAPVVKVYRASAAAAGPEAAAEAGVQIVVEDNGIGIEEKFTERIFGIFQRLHNRTAYEGTGIGLAVCRKIVARHGGTITARSTPGVGTRFLVHLPPHPPQAEPQGEPT
ncbi:MAG: HAMP domain-containing protein [Lentisphaeria bacterium]|nr:HAMP domain-containing protein [Lentisphaeria bacterium]